MSEMPTDILEIVITAPTAEVLSSIVNEYGIDTGCTCGYVSTEGTSVVGLVSRQVFDRLRDGLDRRSGTRDRGAVNVQFRENRTATADNRRALVGRHNRFASRSAVPEGQGIKE